MTNSQFARGDRIRANLRYTTDLGHEKEHGRIGEVVEIFEDNASEQTDDNRDAMLLRLKFEITDVFDFRWRDLCLVKGPTSTQELELLHCLEEFQVDRHAFPFIEFRECPFIFG